MGFAITTALFLPLGLGHLKEAMTVQLMSFFFMIVLVGLFFYEFLARGLDYKLPMVGPDLSQSAGKAAAPTATHSLTPSRP